MTILEAINICLTNGAGIRPISSADQNDQGSKDIIDRERKALLLSSWPFNEDAVDLTRDANNEIPVSSRWLLISLPFPIVVRAGKLYNRQDRTTIMAQDFPDSAIQLDMSLEDMPQQAANLVAWRAAKAFSAAKRGANSSYFGYCQDQFLNAEVEMGMAYPAQNDFGKPIYYIGPETYPADVSTSGQYYWNYCRY